MDRSLKGFTCSKYQTIQILNLVARGFLCLILNFQSYYSQMQNVLPQYPFETAKSSKISRWNCENYEIMKLLLADAVQIVLPQFPLKIVKGRNCPQYPLEVFSIFYWNCEADSDDDLYTNCEKGFNYDNFRFKWIGWLVQNLSDWYKIKTGDWMSDGDWFSTQDFIGYDVRV